MRIASDMCIRDMKIIAFSIRYFDTQKRSETNSKWKCKRDERVVRQGSEIRVQHIVSYVQIHIGFSQSGEYTHQAMQTP